MSVKQLAKKVLERLAKYEVAKAGVKSAKAASLDKEAHILSCKVADLHKAADSLRAECGELMGSAITIHQLASKLK
ncbi:hypothetical protein P2_0025 [Aeromonas phage P2]|uniref:Uncharacterized protein n=1 Tax=Aeromonas phage P2 TaxID=2996101 RepID=A0A9E8K2Z4_9CAUD|nr:hypothetical protein P2_0025 [Aeromonas phage P2]